MRREVGLVLFVCLGFGAVGWFGDFHGLYREAGSDWVIFYQAARAWLDGNVALLFDGDAFTRELNLAFASWFPHPLPLHAWIYPPTFLLLFLPFGLIPPQVAYPAFLLLTAGGLAAALVGVFGHDRRGLGYIFVIALDRAVPFAVLTGQNSFLSGSLLIGGYGLLARHPLIGGTLFGLLSFKPQLGLMVPVALIASRQWKALAAAAAAAALLTLGSLALFGPELWRSWILLALGRGDLYDGWLPTARIYGSSVFADAVALGASAHVANLVQAFATLCAGACVFVAFRRVLPDPLRLAVLLAGTVLAAPHISIYDSILLATAATLLLRHAVDTGFRADDVPLILALWVSPLINPPSAVAIGAFTPLLILCFMVRVVTRNGIAAPARLAVDPVG